jgi:hypothetical protein
MLITPKGDKRTVELLSQSNVIRLVINFSGEIVFEDSCPRYVKSANIHAAKTPWQFLHFCNSVIVSAPALTAPSSAPTSAATKSYLPHKLNRAHHGFLTASLGAGLQGPQRKLK